jgi:ABC-type branched-subunit amino acid transport system ATPase component
LSIILYTDKLYGGYLEDINILLGVDVEIGEGEIVTLAGPNGSGKSTLVRAIMGLLPRCKGRIFFENQDLHGIPCEDRIKMGISYVPQVANTFLSLNVTENLEVVETTVDKSSQMRLVFGLFPALSERRRRRAASLSGGERQQLAFARALMSRPRLMILDEPTANLSPVLVEQVFGLIRNLPGLSISSLIVEQRARMSLAISDRGYILDSGKVVLSGDASALLKNEAMAELYLGQTPQRSDTRYESL